MEEKLHKISDILKIEPMAAEILKAAKAAKKLPNETRLRIYATLRKAALPLVGSFAKDTRLRNGAAYSEMDWFLRDFLNL